jgi:hypothetical protein
MSFTKTLAASAGKTGNARCIATIEMGKPRAGGLRRETGASALGGVGRGAAACGGAAIDTAVRPVPEAGATHMEEAS